MKAAWMYKTEKPIIKEIMTCAKSEIMKFQQYLSLLNQSAIPDDMKKEMAASVNTIQIALKNIKVSFPERDFEIAFAHFFNQVPCYVLGEQHFLDKSRIVRINKHFILKVAEQLYPELYTLGDTND